MACRCWNIFTIILLNRLAAHVVEVGDLNTEQGLLALVKFDDILTLDAIVSGDEECLEGLALELFFLRPEIVFNLGLLDSIEGFGLGVFVLLRLFTVLRLGFISCQLGILGLYGEKASVLLIPEGLDWDAIWTDLKLHEVVHVNVVNVDLDIGDGDRWEGDLVR